MAAEEPNYSKYLEQDPTALMEHIEPWIRNKAGVDPTKFKTKAEAFKYGVYLTVALRMTHQASPENQERLAAKRKAADAVTAEKAERREARAAAGTKPRVRASKAAVEEPAEKAAPKPRGRRPKSAEVVPGVPSAEPAAPKRRGRPKKETAAEAVADAPKRRGRPRKAAVDSDVPAEETEAPSNVTQLPTTRRRPVRRGEAAF
jgi:hypothetical protein